MKKNFLPPLSRSKFRQTVDTVFRTFSSLIGYTIEMFSV